MLYFIGSPIGNFGDISQRALDILKSVPVILVEKWSDSVKLLNHFGIKPIKILSFDERNQKKVLPLVIEILRKKNIAFLTSAGMPGVSDPGAALARACYGAGISVVPIPGPSALSAAISASGMAGDFLFVGFLPKKRGQIENVFAEAAENNHNLVFFESPHRLGKTLEILAIKYPDAEIFVGKEMTKKFEKYLIAKPAEILKIARLDSKFLKGEFALIVKFNGQSHRKVINRFGQLLI